MAIKCVDQDNIIKGDISVVAGLLELLQDAWPGSLSLAVFDLWGAHWQLLLARMDSYWNSSKQTGSTGAWGELNHLPASFHLSL